MPFLFYKICYSLQHMRGKEILQRQNFTICRKWPSRLCNFQVPLKGNSLIRSSVPEKCKNCVSFKFKSNFVAFWILIDDIDWRLINMNFCTLVRQLQPLSYWKTSGKQWKKRAPTSSNSSGIINFTISRTQPHSLVWRIPSATYFCTSYLKNTERLTTVTREL